MSSLITCKYDFKCNLVAVLLFTTVYFAFVLDLTSKEAAKSMQVFQIITLSAIFLINESAVIMRKAQM